MKHDNDREMLFYFLNMDYNLTSSELDFNNGYNLGDYNHPKKEFYELAQELSQMLRARLVGVFNNEGDIISSRPKEIYKQEKK